MIFVYPAIMSDTVDTKMGAAVAKVLEQYFLLHLQEAIQANSIKFSTSWDRETKSYGPLTIIGENKNYNLISKMLTESEAVLKSVKSQMLEQKGALAQIMNDFEKLLSDDKSGPADRFTSKYIQSVGTDEARRIRSAITEKSNTANEYKNKCDKIQDALDVLESEASLGIDKGDLTRSEYNEVQNVRKSIGFEVVKFKMMIDRYLKQWRELSELISYQLKEKDPIDARIKQKEYEDKIRQQHETHGMYKVEPMKGISLKPTMANISVKIYHYGGPRPEDNQQHHVGELREISIGTKILPLRMSNFGSIENAILDDYFTTNFQATWKTLKRNFMRSALTKIQKWIGDMFDVRGKLDAVNSNILLANHGFISGSAFEHKRTSSPIYKLSSAIVVFNKQDLMKEEGSNFFLNRSKVNEMFKMGWNAFCILDHHREEALFISSIDGGYLHVIPYSYIFNTLGMDDVFKNINDLQKRSPIFRNHGNFSSFVSRLRKESKLRSAIKLISGG